MFGYVFYPDGGCRGQYEYGGAGIHGYRWNLNLTAKGIGHTTHSATLRGYDTKSESFDFANKETKAAIASLTREDFLQWIKQETGGAAHIKHRVPVERYYDCFVPLDFGGTNNTAELNAAIYCLERIVTEPDFDKTTIIVMRQDSRYVVDGFSLYLVNWMAKDFIRKDGSVVSNKDLWYRMHAIASAIRARGISIVFEWVEAHSTCPGNNSADELATAGVFTSKNPKAVAALDTSFRISEVTDYWASRGDVRHPMLCFRYSYLGIDSAEKERREYYLSTQGKVSDMNGKRTSDDGFSVVRCAPQKHIEEIVTKQISLPREIDYRFQIDLDNVYSSGGRYLELYGTDFLHRAVEHKRHLQTFGKVLLTTELHPPYLVDRVFDNMDILADFLDTYMKSDEPTLMTTDITSDFFVCTEEAVKVKKGEEPRTKTVCTLKPGIGVGYFKHSTKGWWKETIEEVKECELTLRLGVDLPDRNALRRLEDKNPKVYLLTNTLGPGSFMYAVVIEAGDDVGIWSGINSSIRITAKTPVIVKTVGK
jgi:ribonuclease HI